MDYINWYLCSDQRGQDSLALESSSFHVSAVNSGCVHGWVPPHSFKFWKLYFLQDNLKRSLTGVGFTVCFPNESKIEINILNT